MFYAKFRELNLNSIMKTLYMTKLELKAHTTLKETAVVLVFPEASL